jgi:type II secretory pathway component PulJ
MPKIIPGWKARQGDRGFHILLVLVAGLLLAAIAWGGAEFYGEIIDQNATQAGTPSD